MTPKEMYLEMFMRSAPRFAEKLMQEPPKVAREMAEAFSAECVQAMMNRGMLEMDGRVVQPINQQPIAQVAEQQSAHPPVIGAQPGGQTPAFAPVASGLPPFLQSVPGTHVAQGVGAPQTQVAMGAGGVSEQTQPFEVSGAQVIPPPGNTFQPPVPAGAMNTVQQQKIPEGSFNALGTAGVITPPIQKPPSGPDRIVSPGNQSVITGVGGTGGSMFVPETVGH